MQADAEACIGGRGYQAVSRGHHCRLCLHVLQHTARWVAAPILPVANLCGLVVWVILHRSDGLNCVLDVTEVDKGLHTGRLVSHATATLTPD